MSTFYVGIIHKTIFFIGAFDNEHMPTKNNMKTEVETNLKHKFYRTQYWRTRRAFSTSALLFNIFRSKTLKNLILQLANRWVKLFFFSSFFSQI